MDSEGMRGSGRRGAGPGSAFGGMPHGMFFTTSMHGNPTVFGYGGSRYVVISHTSVTGSVLLSRLCFSGHSVVSGPKRHYNVADQPCHTHKCYVAGQPCHTHNKILRE